MIRSSLLRRRPPLDLAIALVACLIALVAPATGWAGQNWPGWRGSRQDLTASGAGVFETGKTYRLEVAWKKSLGSGYSAISIVDGIAVTLFSDGDSQYAAAFTADTGDELWRAEIGPRFPGRYGSQDGPVSTPLIAGGKVFALDPSGPLFAFDLETGEKLWSSDLAADHQGRVPFYGFSTSPVAWDDSVIVLTGGGEGKAVTAFDAATGEVRWQTGNDRIDYQSPLLTRVGDQDQLLVFGAKELVGLNPSTGETLWQMEHGGDGRAIGSSSANVLRTSGDRFLLKPTAEASVLVELAPGEEGIESTRIWESPHLKRSYVVPVAHDGHIYGYNTRILACVDERTGELAWRSRPPGDGFPIIVDGHLVIVTKSGTLSVAPASPDGYQEIASIELFDDLVWAPATFADGSLFVRSFSEWARVEIVSDETRSLVEDDSGGIVPDSEFGRLVTRVRDADEKAALIDEYMAAQTSFPIVEVGELVHFVFRGPGEDLALVSDLFGGRTDRPMHRVEGTDLFYYSARLETDARLLYSFIRDFEEAIDLDPLNSEKVEIGPDEFSSVVAMPGWRAPAHLSAPEGGPRGKVVELPLAIPSLEGEASEEEKSLKVYLPRGYDPDGPRLPVAYVPNGMDRLDDGTMVNTLDNVVGATVEPIVVVFVPHLGGFPYATYVGDGKDEYVRILIEEIVPLVDRTYATAPVPASRALIGGWFTGYTSVYAAFNHPEIFGGLGLQSVRWEPGYEDRNRALLAESNLDAPKIYLDWGKYDWRSPMEGLNGPEMGRAFARALEENGYDFVGGETHEGGGWPSWRNRTDVLLETLFPMP